MPAYSAHELESSFFHIKKHLIKTNSNLEHSYMYIISSFITLTLASTSMTSTQATDSSLVVTQTSA